MRTKAFLKSRDERKRVEMRFPAHPGLLKVKSQTALRGLEAIGGRIEGREMVAA
jgi:hypothetical protein